MTSPCRRICKFTPGTDICSGCFRTLYEIQAWPLMRDEQKEYILSRVNPQIEMKSILNDLVYYYDNKLFDGKLEIIINRARKFKE